MRKFLQYLLVGTFAIGALAGLAACDSGGKSVDDALKDQGVSVNDEGDVQISSEEGDVSFGSGSEVPDDFPDGVPLPEDANLVGSSSVSDGDAKTFTLIYGIEKAEDVSGAVDSYKDALTDAGFTIDSDYSGSSDTGGFASFTASDDDYEVSVYAGGDTSSSGGDEGGFTVSVSPKSSM